MSAPATMRWCRTLPEYYAAVVVMITMGVERYGSKRRYAEQFDAHPSDVSKWFTGYSQPTSSTLWRMAEPLEASFMLAVPSPGGRRLLAMRDQQQAMRVLRAVTLEQYGTLRALGARAGVSPDQLGRWFRGTVEPGGRWLWLLADTAGARILLTFGGYG